VERTGASLDTVFAKFDYDKQETLSFYEFNQLICSLDPVATYHDVKSLYAALDIGKEDKISRADFLELFRNFDFRDRNKAADRIAGDLREIIRANHINLHSIFKMFDLEGNQQLDRGEFCLMIRLIARDIP